MRIGIDARFLTHPQQGGFKSYTENLVREIAELDNSNEYVIYTDRPGAEELFGSKNVTVKSVSGAAPVREQINLPAEMAKDRIDLAHYLCNTGPIKQSIPTVLTVHDLIPCLPKQGRSKPKSHKDRAITAYWRYVMPRTIGKASHIVTISQVSKRDIVGLLGIPESHVTVVYNGLHPDFKRIDNTEELNQIRAKYNLPNRFLMGFASSDQRKNTAGLLRAAGILAKDFPDINVVLICATQAAKDMAQENLAKEAPGLKLTILNHVSRQDLVAIYNVSDALVFPSFYEGFGLPVIEAMACGAPVIASNTSSIPEVAGGAAILIDPRNANGTAEALKQVITNPQLRVKLVSDGMKRAAMFSWKRAASETIAVYEKVLSELTAQAKTNKAEQVAGGSAG